MLIASDTRRDVYLFRFPAELACKSFDNIDYIAIVGCTEDRVNLRHLLQDIFGISL